MSYFTDEEYQEQFATIKKRCLEITGLLERCREYRRMQTEPSTFAKADYDVRRIEERLAEAEADLNKFEQAHGQGRKKVEAVKNDVSHKIVKEGTPSVHNPRSDMQYVDFYLKITEQGDKYCAETERSGSRHIFEFDATEFNGLILRLRKARKDDVRREEVRELGATLFKSVLGGDVKTVFDSTYTTARNRGQNLRIVLQLQDVPRLANLPWEYLYKPDQNLFLGLFKESPIVRYPALPIDIDSSPINGALRMLVVISNPSDVGGQRLAVEKEWEKLKEALQPLEDQQLLEIERLGFPTLRHLQTHLRQNHYHIFHFIGHGSSGDTATEGKLAFETSETNKKAEWVSGELLASKLRGNGFRLAVLNACEAGRTGLGSPFDGVVGNLLETAEIPAIVAMQFEITDQAAIDLASEFYTCLAEGYPIEAALSEGRNALQGQGDAIEWGTPVLYMRAKSGKLFDLTQPSQASNNVKPSQQGNTTLNASYGGIAIGGNVGTINNQTRNT